MKGSIYRREKLTMVEGGTNVQLVIHKIHVKLRDEYLVADFTFHCWQLTETLIYILAPSRNKIQNF